MKTLAAAPLPDLNRLAFFAAVAQSGGFTAAADRLGVAKAKVSIEVRRLEAALGANLFSRTTRRVILTEAGRRLYETSAPLLSELTDTLALAGAGQAAIAGRLRLSMPVNYAANQPGKWVAEFARQHPALHIELSATDRIVDLVGEGFDVAIRAGWLRSSSLRATRLGEMDQYVVAAPAYLRGLATPKRPPDLADHEWIALSLLPAPLTWKFHSRRGRTLAARVRARMTTDSPGALHALVLGGAGITVLTEDMVAEDIKRGRLQRLLEDWSLPRVGVYAVYPPGRHIPANARAFVEFCRARLQPAVS